MKRFYSPNDETNVSGLGESALILIGVAIVGIALALAFGIF
jgi:hypothetical protein